MCVKATVLKTRQSLRGGCYLWCATAYKPCWRHLCLAGLWASMTPSTKLSILDSMRWFSHRRSPGGTQWYRLLLRAASCVRPSYSARPTMHCQLGWWAVFVFCPWWPWPLTLTFELGRDFCTVYLTAKFDRHTFSRSEVTVRTNILTNKQTDAAENIHLASLRYAGG